MRIRNVVKFDLGEHTVSEFIDGEGAAGTKTIDMELPAGFFPLLVSANVTEAFKGTDSTGSTLLIGVTGDTDAYLASASVFTVDKRLATRPTNPAVGINADQAVLLTVTAVDSTETDADFGDLDTGIITLTAFGIFIGTEEDVSA